MFNRCNEECVYAHVHFCVYINYTVTWCNVKRQFYALINLKKNVLIGMVWFQNPTVIFQNHKCFMNNLKTKLKICYLSECEIITILKPHIYSRYSSSNLYVKKKNKCIYCNCVQCVFVTDTFTVSSLISSLMDSFFCWSLLSFSIMINNIRRW